MITSNREKVLRELIRQIEAKLGILNEMESSCCGVSFTQCHAITEIGRSGNISLSELAEKLNVDNSTMSKTVNNIVNKGLANREIDPNDRRYVTISLTEEGKKVFEEIEYTMNNYFKKIYENIPENKREQVLESLKLLTDAITKGVCCGK
ncbi:MAG TPA: MarR family transcriptional regulator [Acetivibrio sp.]|uniref:MarR family winged helix-turn-helix transcriptional regulator n=1 Tax=Acetivibrio sp. TaxID=1872092 RepID=UPI002C02C868|nr:MarR family transcriptional regulator [Acetivibrio sp.]HOM02674.1 MarR family transcriptional regulator [Acetivibrio sp.]